MISFLHVWLYFSKTGTTISSKTIDPIVETIVKCIDYSFCAMIKQWEISAFTIQINQNMLPFDGMILDSYI